MIVFLFCCERTFFKVNKKSRIQNSIKVPCDKKVCVDYFSTITDFDCIRICCFKMRSIKSNVYILICSFVWDQEWDQFDSRTCPFGKNNYFTLKFSAVKAWVRNILKPQVWKWVGSFAVAFNVNLTLKITAAFGG